MITVFSKEWFSKYNKPITWLARLPILGELVFNFKKFGHYIDRKNIVEITPNSVIEFVKRKGKKVELRQHFFVRNEYALRLQKVCYPIWITFHIWDIITRPIPQLNLGFDTLTVYPDASSGSTTVDGNMIRSSTSVSLATLVAGAGTGVDKTNVYESLYLGATTTSNEYDYLRRSIQTFDTSSLTSGATISGVVISGYYVVVTTDLGDCKVQVVGSTPASDNDLASSDFSQLGTTSFGYLTLSTITTSQYNDVTLNASGVSNISKTGISKFGLRFGFDGMSETPTWSSGATNQSGCYSGDNATNKYKLVVTYTLPSTNTGNFFMFFN